MSRSQPVGAAGLLDTWEAALPGTPLERSLLLLTGGEPGHDLEALAGLSIGERDRRLLALREQVFGTRIVSLASCPACDARVELDFDVGQIGGDERSGTSAAAPAVVDVALNGYEATFRLPCSRDLAAVAAAGPMERARLQLLRRCVVDVRLGGEAVDIVELPADVVEAIANRMADADPQADIRLALECPECAHGWEASFDIATFLWSELDAWAHRTLQEVSVLARAYGWGEDAILELSPTRRRLYLEMAIA